MKKSKHNFEKTKEEVILDMLEIEAYRQLESHEFNFNGIILKNTGEYKLGSEDAYYEMDIHSLKEALLYFSKTFNEQAKKNKSKLNPYKRKMYWHIGKIIKDTNNYMPWYSYSTKTKDNNYTYYKRYYQCNKKTRKILCKPVRRKLNRCINGDYDICSMKGRNWKKIYDYKWDIW